MTPDEFQALLDANGGVWRGLEWKPVNPHLSASDCPAWKSGNVSIEADGYESWVWFAAWEMVHDVDILSLECHTPDLALNDLETELTKVAGGLREFLER